MNTTVKKLKVLKLIILTLVAAGILLALTACGSADSLEFKLIMDEYYVVTDVKEDYPQKIVVPSKYEGLPVREIGSSAFANCKNLKSVVLPNSIRYINIRAFYNCVLLEEVRLGSNVKSIGHSAFSGCEKLKKITIPAKTEKIGDYVFSGCDNLETITVKSGNKIYSGTGKCLTEKKTKTLLAGGTKSKIPDDGSVATIGENAFAGRNIKNIVVPDGVTLIKQTAFGECRELETCILPDECEIEQALFYFCDNLKWVVLPQSITYIDLYCFGYCSSLQSIFYKGTEQQWENVEVVETRGEKVYFYSEEKPAQNDGGYWHFDSAGNPVIW